MYQGFGKQLSTDSICSSTLSCWLCTASNENCCIQAKVGLKDNALRYFSSWRPLHPCRHKCPPLLYTMLRQDKHTFGACPGVECRHYKMHIPLEMYIGCKHKLIAAFINLTAGHVWSCTLKTWLSIPLARAVGQMHGSLRMEC